AGLVNVFAGCGSESADVPATGDAGDASSSSDARQQTDSSVTSDGGLNPLPDDASLNDAAVCKPTGQSCSRSTDCCTANCNATSGLCEAPLGECKAPNAACSA